METRDTDREVRLLWKLKIRAGRIVLWKLQLRTGRIDYCGKLRYVPGEQIIVETEDTDRENRLLF